jgi:cobaltochelatase CobS
VVHEQAELTPDMAPDTSVDVRDVFGIDQDLSVPAFSRRTAYVPVLDEDYRFDRDTTLAILAGFAHNRRVMIQGYHGTGKSTHIEQVAARLNWPCVRINLDSHISRIDLIGKDAIVIKDGQQITEFREGMLPWALQHPVALVFDEYDAGRPDVMFVIQRVLEVEGKLTLLDQNKVIEPHPYFRLFATTNTIGLGDSTGLYHGTQQINQGQMDRWSIVTTLNYLPHDQETEIVLGKAKHYAESEKGAGRRPHGGGGGADPPGLHERRRLGGHVAPHGAHLGAECRDLRRRRLRLPGDVPQQVRRARAPHRRRVLPALHGRGSRGRHPGDQAEERVISP